MSFTTKIQSLISTHTNNAGHSVQCALDWVNNVQWQYNTSSDLGGTWLTEIGIATGAEIAFQDASIYTGAFHEFPVGVDANGVYITNLAGTIYQINQSTLALTQTLASGIVCAQGTFSPITDTTGTPWLFISGPGNSFAGYGCVKTSTTPMVLWGAGVLTYTGYSGANCAGPIGSGLGYMISGDNIASTSGGGLRLYKVNVNLGVQGGTLLATIAPATIDAGWTVAGQNGICLDQSDGNILIFCQGQGAATNPYYMVKLSASTGAIIWKLVIPGIGGGNQVAQSVIKAQQYTLIRSLGGGVNECNVIDTNAGAITSTFTTGLANTIPFNAQCFNDQTGAIIGEFSYTAGAGAPVQLNSTPASFGGWAAVYVVAPKPAFSAILGSGFFIERMDNREWPAVENVWCVDCALQTSLPTFNATLTASSSTGAGIPTGVTNLFGGQGYSASTVATIEDPTGTGAGVSLTIASGIITGITIAGGTGYTYPQLVITDPTQRGAGASADITLDNSAVFQASAAVFNSGMTGDVIRMGGGTATITAYTNSQQVTANIISPIVEVLPNSGGIPIPQEAGDWSISVPTSIVYGLMHLIGYTITGVADGAVITPRVVQPNGSVTLDSPATLITIGLPFTPQFQSLYLDGGNPTVQGQRKKVAEVTVRLDASGVTGIQGGSNQPTGSAQSPPVQDIPWTEMDTFQVRPDQALPPYGSTTPSLFTGDVNQPVSGGFDKPGQVAFQQTLPLPMNITAIVPDTLEGDQPEQGYTPKPQRPPSGKPKSGRK